MITPAYSPTATERVLPRLALDFTTGVLDPRVTVTRALNTATRVNSSGLIVGVNADLPRFDYDPVTLASRGLLIEETRINLIAYSSDISDPAWTKVRTTTSGTFTSPDGTSNAYKLEENDTTTNTYFLRYDVASPAGIHTLSFFAKKAERDVVFASLDGASNTKWFDLTNGTTGGSGGGTSTIQAFPNGWYRCTYTFTTTGGTVFNFILLGEDTSGISYTGVIGDGAYIWGAQLEAGAFATSYIPTTTTSLTRNADVVSMTGTNFSSWYNASEGALMVQADTLTVANPNNMTLASLLLNGSDNIRYWMWQGQPANLRYTVTASGASSADIANAISANTQFKVMCSYATNLFRCALNGSAPSVDTNGAVPSGLNVFYIGSLDSVNEPFSGHVAKINYYNQSVTSGEVQAFSK